MEKPEAAPEPSRPPGERVDVHPGVSDHDWGIEQRRFAEERFSALEFLLDEAEEQTDVILARVAPAGQGEETMRLSASDIV